MTKPSTTKAAEPRTGDVFTFRVGPLHYALQYVDVVFQPQHSHVGFRFRAHVIVFDGEYSSVPEQPDTRRIYRIRSKPKGQLLYVLLLGREPFLPSGLNHWGNIEPSWQWEPRIQLSRDMPVVAREVDGVTVTPTVSTFDYVRGRLAEDQKRKTRKEPPYTPRLFPEWAPGVDSAVIKRAEALVARLREDLTAGSPPEKALAACIRSLNALDEKHGFIGTLEAEDLVEVLGAEAVEAGMTDEATGLLIDEFREW